MDHFCVWMNTTVGSRNYPGFFLVALFSSLLLWFQMGMSVAAVILNDEPTATTVLLSISQFVCAAAVAAPYSVLLTFHVYLIVKQISTFDYLMLRAQAKATKRKALAKAESGETKVTTTSYTAGTKGAEEVHAQD